MSQQWSPHGVNMKKSREQRNSFASAQPSAAPGMYRAHARATPAFLCAHVWPSLAPSHLPDPGWQAGLPERALLCG